jgi:uncharacterized membrane protein
MTEPRPRGWQLDRQIPLTLVFALIIQAAMALFWSGHAAERIEALERQSRAQMPVAERLARLEVQTAAMRAQLDRMELKLDRQVTK